MTPQEALDVLREHLTTLYANPRMYEDGTDKLVQALEAYAIPLLEEYPIHITMELGAPPRDKKEWILKNPNRISRF